MDLKRCKNEIELFELLAIFWKCKYLIISVAVLFAIGGSIIYYYQPLKYRLSMTILPGAAEITKSIKASIENRVFSNDIANNLEGSKVDEPIRFDVSIFGNEYLLKIAYETTNKDLGKAVLINLYNLLSKHIAAKLEPKKKKLLEDIGVKKQQKDILVKKQQILQRSLTRFIRRFDGLSSDSGSTDGNIGPSELNEVQLIDYQIAKVNWQIDLLSTEQKLQSLSAKIKELETLFDSIQNITMIKPPDTDSAELVSKPMYYITFSALVLGLFVSFGLVIVLEYLKRASREPKNIDE